MNSLGSKGSGSWEVRITSISGIVLTRFRVTLHTYLRLFRFPSVHGFSGGTGHIENVGQCLNWKEKSSFPVRSTSPETFWYVTQWPSSSIEGCHVDTILGLLGLKDSFRSSFIVDPSAYGVIGVWCEKFFHVVFRLPENVLGSMTNYRHSRVLVP